MNNPKDRAALVTGSSRGLGRGMAQRLAADGSFVIVHGRDREAIAYTVATIVDDGGRAAGVLADLSQPSGVDDLLEAVRSTLVRETGSEQFDILVNNAGFSHTVAPEEATPELFDELMAVNARAPLFLIQKSLPYIRNGGRIINTSSALTRFAWPQELTYAMSKGALEQLALHLARYLGPRSITINTIAVGTSDNGSGYLDDNPKLHAEIASYSVFGRWGESATVADVVGFLASHDARWVTGAWIDASGGVLV